MERHILDVSASLGALCVSAVKFLGNNSGYSPKLQQYMYVHRKRACHYLKCGKTGLGKRTVSIHRSLLRNFLALILGVSVTILVLLVNEPPRPGWDGVTRYQTK